MSTTILLSTSDPTDQVAAYYRDEMPKHGWKALDEQKAVQDGQSETIITVDVRPRQFGRAWSP
jgi:hypothetical protein